MPRPPLSQLHCDVRLLQFPAVFNRWMKLVRAVLWWCPLWHVWNDSWVVKCKIVTKCSECSLLMFRSVGSIILHVIREVFDFESHACIFMLNSLKLHYHKISCISSLFCKHYIQRMIASLLVLCGIVVSTQCFLLLL